MAADLLIKLVCLPFCPCQCDTVLVYSVFMMMRSFPDLSNPVLSSLTFGQTVRVQMSSGCPALSWQGLSLLGSDLGLDSFL